MSDTDATLQASDAMYQPDNRLLCDACKQFDANIKDQITALTNTLDALSKALARDGTKRVALGSGSPTIWPCIRKVWRDLARAQLTFWDGDDSDDADTSTTASENKKQQDLNILCLSLAKFTRNLAAEVPENQIRAFENEPEIRRLLHYHSSWSANQDTESFPVTRMLAQALSNIVTTNDALMSKLWNVYLNLPEDQVVLIRLLSSPDDGTVLAVMVLILNCIHNDKTRAKLLCKTTIGCRVCVSLLDSMIKLFEASDSSNGARAFDVGYDIFTQLIEGGLTSELYTRLSMQDEIVTPHQTTLLKLIDSYLQSSQAAASVSTPTLRKINRKLSPMLSKAFFTQCLYMQRSIRRSLGLSSLEDGPTNLSNETEANGRTSGKIQESQQVPVGTPPVELDVMLPKICESLVLVTQCISSITLEPEERESSPIEAPENPSTASLRSARSFATFREYFNETRYADNGLVETLIATLKLLDLFLPRINFGKPIISNNISGLPTSSGSTPGVNDGSGFGYLKRDLVRLLGILCHGTRSVQDRVRKSGGIEVVMNLCVVDERNPYLREHAIFTLHNLLEGNAENQEVVDQIKPSGSWGEDGVLRDTPGAVRR